MKPGLQIRLFFQISDRAEHTVIQAINDRHELHCRVRLQIVCGMRVASDPRRYRDGRNEPGSTVGKVIRVASMHRNAGDHFAVGKFSMPGEFIGQAAATHFRRRILDTRTRIALLHGEFAVR